MQSPFDIEFQHPGGLTLEDMIFPRPVDTSEMPRAEKTRTSLMEAAAAEIYEKGYNGAALSDILERAGATKGALYHHFADKHALGLSAMDYFLHKDLDVIWLDPFRTTDDPLSTLINLIGFMHTCGAMEIGLKQGCPLVNLTEEMSVKDEGFRELVAGMNEEWRTVMATALRRGQAVGTVRKDIDPDGVSMLCLAVRHGVLSQAKMAGDPELLGKCAVTYFEYLNSLRPASSEDTATSVTN